MFYVSDSYQYQLLSILKVNYMIHIPYPYPYFENGKVIDIGNYRTRKTLESWHTAIITNSDNNSKPLPRQSLDATT